MTFCKILREKTTPGGLTVAAYENIDKYSSVPYYEIVIAENGIAREVIPAARTTWARKFNQVYNENK